MKIIFLDVDGVLNCQATFAKFGSTDPLDPDMVARLQDIVAKTGAKIVLSSVWRRYEELLQKVREHLIGVEIIGETPEQPRPAGAGVEYCERGKEIETWIQEHPEITIEKYCAIDDDRDFLAFQKLFKTKFSTGLTQEIANQVIDYLNS